MYAQGLDDVLTVGVSDVTTLVRQLFDHVLALGPETLHVVRALIAGAIPVELVGFRDEFRTAVRRGGLPGFALWASTSDGAWPSCRS